MSVNLSNCANTPVNFNTLLTIVDKNADGSLKLSNNHYPKINNSEITDISVTKNGVSYTNSLSCWKDASNNQISTLNKVSSELSSYKPIKSSYDEKYDSSMMAGVVWAMLGTTVLYYAFTKI